MNLLKILILEKNSKVFKQVQKNVDKVFSKDITINLDSVRKDILKEVKDKDFKDILVFKNVCYKNACGYRGYEKLDFLDKDYLKVRDNLLKYVIIYV